MAKRKKSKRYSSKTYKVYGSIPFGNWHLNTAMNNDERLYNFVRRNNKKLARMRKDSAIKVIKSRANESWAKEDLRKVNSRNVNGTDLKKYLRDFNG